MTVSVEDNRIIYFGNGTVGPFAIPFPFLADTYIKVVQTLIAAPFTETVLALTTDFTLTGAGSVAGSLTLTAPRAAILTAAYKLTIYRDPDILQTTDYLPNDGFPAESHERGLDKLTMIANRFKDLLSRAFRLSDGDTSGINLTVPSPVADAFLKVNAAKTALEFGLAAGVLAVSAFGQTILNTASQVTARALLGISTLFDTLADAKGDRIVATANDTWAKKSAPANGYIPVADSAAADGWTDQVGAMAWGHCQLTKSGANLLLSRFSGRGLFINGKWEDIPVAGVTLAPPAVASTTYNIYAFMNAGAINLEQSVTAHAADATYGHRIKNGDATRTLVGMARTTAGNAWLDDTTACLVLSYFNRRVKGIVNRFTTNRTRGSAVQAEIDVEIRGNFLTWGDEAVGVSIQGGCNNDTLGSQAQTWINFDGGVSEVATSTWTPYTASAAGPCACAASKSGLAEGFHYATLFGAASANTALWAGGAVAASSVVSLYVSVRG